MVKKMNLDKAEVEAARSIMFELMSILSAFRSHLVVIGGSVPGLMFTKADKPHSGTLDVDLAIDRRVVGVPDMFLIENILKKNGYSQSGSTDHVFYKNVNKEDRKIPIKVELLTGESADKTKGIAMAVPGCDLAFERPIESPISGLFPDGSEHEVMVRYASIVPMICMKAMALKDRNEPKDAYDIYYFIKNFEAGTKNLASEFIKLQDVQKVEEGITLLKEEFSDIHSIGPRYVADFMGERDEMRREQNIRDAFEQVNALLSLL
jgi:predicted nucleotidyltransferase